MVSALDSGASGLGSSPGRGHCVVFLGKTLNSHNASLHPGVEMGTGEPGAQGELNAGVTHPRGKRNTLSRFMLQQPGSNADFTLP